MVMRRRDDVYNTQAFRRNHTASHAHVRLVRCGILARQRIGKIGVEKQVASLPLHEKTALPQPPDVKPVSLGAGAFDVSKKGIVGKDRQLHRDRLDPINTIESGWSLQRSIP